MKTADVIVVGGGWAGLAAAVELADGGLRVQLLEAAPQLGGRARGLDYGGDRVDNGQHLIIGAYRQTLALLQRLGIDPRDVFQRLPMRLPLLSADAPALEFTLPRLPAPLNLLWALARTPGLAAAERRSALRFALAMGVRRFRLSEDLPLAELLRRYRQPPRLISTLWTPICLATLNTPLEEASSQLFLNVLRDMFSRRSHDADLLLCSTDLGTLLPEPAVRHLHLHGGEVTTSCRVNGLLLEGGRIAGVRSGEVEYHGPQVVLATPPEQAAALLRPYPAMADTVARIEALGSYPITTVYLRYGAAVELPHPMVGLLDSLGHWISERRVCGQDKLLSVVISGPGPHMDMDRAALAQTVSAEVAGHFPHLPPLIDALVIREKRAAFRARCGVQALRPDHETALPGLWLAGDYTAGPYPSTLEGAVRSGLQCARRILQRT